MDKFIQVISEKDYIVPKLILLNYKKLSITAEELILIIYLINNDNCFDLKKISYDLNVESKSIMQLINSLVSKNLATLEVKKKGNTRSEYVNLGQIYKKIAFDFIEEKQEKNNNIFDRFETEFGRTLSPMEYEIINSWLENFKEETIILALKESIYNGVSNLRYIDRILYEWQKKGIETEEDIEKDRKKFNSHKKVTETFDYDWLNNE
ncbi:MAG: DnaD domain protein [Clostridium sp.]|nr:DnaD domain protein [Clostridium sp.]MCM1444164.1 DnaD domain protein [Candidatus Amulumruptor caecigallinarius]